MKDVFHKFIFGKVPTYAALEGFLIAAIFMATFASLCLRIFSTIGVLLIALGAIDIYLVNKDLVDEYKKIERRLNRMEEMILHSYQSEEVKEK